MARESELTGIIRPDVDSRQLSREADSMNEQLDRAAEVTPNVNTDGLRRRLEGLIPGGGRIGSALDGLRGGGDGAGGQAGLGQQSLARLQEETLASQQASTELGEERTDLLEDIRDALDGNGIGGRGEGGGGGLGGAGAAGRALGGASGAIGLAALLGGGIIGASRVLNPEAAERQENRTEDIFTGDILERLESALATQQDPLGTGEGLAPLIEGVPWTDVGPPIAQAMYSDLKSRVSDLPWPDPPSLTGLSWPDLPDLTSLNWPDLPDLTGLGWPDYPSLSSAVSWPDIEAPGWISAITDNPLSKFTKDSNESAGSNGNGTTRDSSTQELTNRDQGSGPRRPEANQGEQSTSVNVGPIQVDTGMSRQQRQALINEVVSELTNQLI